MDPPQTPSGGVPSPPWTPLRRMADDLDHIERMLPQRSAAGNARARLAEYYGTSPRAVLETFRVRPSARASGGIRSARGQRGCVGGGGATTLSDSSMSSSDEEKVTALFRPGRDDPDDFFRKVRIDTSHKKRRDNAQLVGELMRRIASEEDAEELLQWVDANQVPVPAGHVGGPVNQMQLRAPEGAAAEGPGAPPEAVAVATTNDLQRAFARKFPMTGAQDRAQEELERIKQRTGIRAHNRAYCKGLMKSGKVANTTPAEVQLLTGRTDRMAYVKSTSKVVHEMIEEEFGTVESMRAHLLKRLHNLGNVHALQHEAACNNAMLE